MNINVNGQNVTLNSASAKHLANELSKMVLHQSPSNVSVERDLSNLELALRRSL